MKRNKTPQNEKYVLKAKKKYKDKREWVVCIVCGDYCPITLDENGVPLYDNVHLTCMYEDNYPALAKKLEKERAEEAKLSLF